MTSQRKNPKETPALEKREERLHRDLDHDGERGEPAAHVKKVLGANAATTSAKTSAKKPLPFGGKQATPFGKKPVPTGKKKPMPKLTVPAPRPKPPFLAKKSAMKAGK